MTYGYELEPLADTSAKLGMTISRPLLDIVNDYAQSLPIVAAHVAPTGAKSFAVYWVSGSSLVMIEGGDFQNENGLAVGHTTGWVRSLSGVRADVEGAAMAELDLKNWTAYRTVKVQFENKALELPDQRSLPLDNDAKRSQVKAFLDAVLKAIAATPPHA